MFNFSQAKDLYLSGLAADGMSKATIAAYSSILGYFSAHCSGNGLDVTTPAAVASYKAQMSAKGNKLVTISMHLNVIRLFFDYAIAMRLLDSENPVLPGLMPSRKKVRAERKPYSHLIGEEEMRTLFAGERPAGVHRGNFLRNRAIILVLLGCGLRNTELRMLTPADLLFGPEDASQITVHSGKGDKFRIVPFPDAVQTAVREYMDSDERPSGLTDQDILFGTGKDKESWHMMSDENLSVLCKRYIKSATGFDDARSHACRHAFSSLNLTHGVPMAEIQAMLGHSSIMTTEHYAALLRPTAPTASGNKVFNSIFSPNPETV